MNVCEHLFACRLGSLLLCVMAGNSDGEATVSTYEATVEGLDALGNLAVNLLKSLLSSNSIRYHTIDHRVKKKESALEKLRNKSDRYFGYSSLMDLLGIRIITYFEDEVDAVAALIEKEFFVDSENSIDKRENLGSDRFGYLSVHY